VNAAVLGQSPRAVALLTRLLTDRYLHLTLAGAAGAGADAGSPPSTLRPTTALSPHTSGTSTLRLQEQPAPAQVQEPSLGAQLAIELQRNRDLTARLYLARGEIPPNDNA